jgi:hypothetical protein
MTCCGHALPARAIAETGGSVGVWHFFATPERYVDGLKGMADVDHVSIGTDASSSTGLFPDAMLR